MLDNSRPKKVLENKISSKIYAYFFLNWNKLFEDIFLAIIHNLRFFFDP